MESPDLVEHYRRRAGEYEAIYAKPERQADLARLRQLVADRLHGKRVIEVACGTGYWTELIARSAAGVTATDMTEEPKPGASVLLLDNRYVEGSSTPLCGRDADGNMYQLRRFADGSEARLLKNFPSEAELLDSLSPHAAAFSYQALDYYWLVEYRLK